MIHQAYWYYSRGMYEAYTVLPSSLETTRWRTLSIHQNICSRSAGKLWPLITPGANRHPSAHLPVPNSHYSHPCTFSALPKRTPDAMCCSGNGCTVRDVVTSPASVFHLIHYNCMKSRQSRYKYGRVLNSRAPPYCSTNEKQFALTFATARSPPWRITCLWQVTSSRQPNFLLDEAIDHIHVALVRDLGWMLYCSQVLLYHADTCNHNLTWWVVSETVMSLFKRHTMMVRGN